MNEKGQMIILFALVVATILAAVSVFARPELACRL